MNICVNTTMCMRMGKHAPITTQSGTFNFLSMLVSYPVVYHPPGWEMGEGLTTCACEIPGLET
jgi:hypothetical protein